MENNDDLGQVADTIGFYHPDMRDGRPLNINMLKSRAKKLKRATDQKHATCLDYVAHESGYHHWAQLLGDLQEQMNG